MKNKVIIILVFFISTITTFSQNKEVDLIVTVQEITDNSLIDNATVRIIKGKQLEYNKTNKYYATRVNANRKETKIQIIISGYKTTEYTIFVHDGAVRKTLYVNKANEKWVWGCVKAFDKDKEIFISGARLKYSCKPFNNSKPCMSDEFPVINDNNDFLLYKIKIDVNAEYITVHAFCENYESATANIKMDNNIANIREVNFYLKKIPDTNNKNEREKLKKDTFTGSQTQDKEVQRLNKEVQRLNKETRRIVKVQKKLTLKRAMNRKKIVPLHGRKTRYRESYS